MTNSDRRIAGLPKWRAAVVALIAVLSTAVVTGATGAMGSTDPSGATDSNGSTEPNGSAGRSAVAELDANSVAAVQCAGFVNETFERIPGGPASILSSKLVAASGNTHEYCAVQGYVQPQIQFEMRLPTRSWNGRYFQVGCGGFCGVVSIESCADVLAQDFAVMAHNMGHVGAIIKEPLWGSDPQLRLDYGGRATHLIAIVGKVIAERFYGKRPARAYFRGCSTGGREGLSEAQRYPQDFDGIVAGDPAFPGRLGAIANNWDARQLVQPDGNPTFTPAKLQVLHAAVLKACDALDGVKDGIVSDPRACRFDVARVTCAANADRPDCLNKAQAEAARRLYGGPVNSSGERLMPGGVPMGSELGWGGKTSGSLPDGYLKYLAFPQNPGGDYGYRSFNFDTDVAKAEEMARLYDPVAPHEAPDLRGFEARGGKLIVYHGWADPGLSPLAVLDYYALVARRQGGQEKVRSWFRVFMVPGMFHCRGGDSPNTFDMLAPMVRWVEKGEAPEQVRATQLKDGQIVRTRPLFPYPTVARYTGHGDVNDAANWSAAQPSVKYNDIIDWIWGPPASVAR